MQTSTKSHQLCLIFCTLLIAGGSAGVCLCWQSRLIFSSVCCLLIVIGAMLTILRHNRRITEQIQYPVKTLSTILTTEIKDSLNQTQNGPQQLEQIMEGIHKQFMTLEAQRLYYNSLLNTVDTPLLVIEHDGSIQWMNRSARENLTGHEIHHIDELATLDSAFPQFIKTLQPGKIRSISITRSNSIQELAASVTIYTEGNGRKHRLVCLRNVHQLMEAKEEESWQKLVRVLTHEIMNSISPVISLSETLCERAQKPCDHCPNVAHEKSTNGYESETDSNEQPSTAACDPLLFQGLQAIRRRSEGLMRFVQNYRRLMRLPAPELRPMMLQPLIDDLQKLYPACKFSISPEAGSRILLADQGQIEQVLINLLKNATEACEEQPAPEVALKAEIAENDDIELCVTDNGPGILPQVMDKIFIPFFTTKQGGSGIGLSLCRQIISRHGGNIRADNRPEGGCIITIQLPISTSSIT